MSRRVLASTRPAGRAGRGLGAEVGAGRGGGGRRRGRRDAVVGSGFGAQRGIWAVRAGGPGIGKVGKVAVDGGKLGEAGAIGSGGLAAGQGQLRPRLAPGQP